MQRLILDSNKNNLSLSLGPTLVDNGCYFAIWSPDAQGIKVHIFDENDKKIKSEVLKERKAGVWFGLIEGVKAKMSYALEAMGQEDAVNGIYNKNDRLLIDPWAKALTKPLIFDADSYEHDSENFIPKAIIQSNEDDFDWQGTKKIVHDDKKGLVIYETHVKGFSILNKELPKEIRGTYLGLAHPLSIKHLKDLGINAVQLMPTAAFMSEPDLTKRGLSNYWGYNPIAFMAPEPRYASQPRNAINEFKTMVRELHKNGIAVILDVVYNHTAEGGFGGPVLSFKGLMNRFFYAFERTVGGQIKYSEYTNVTGCGNSVYVDGRMVLNLVVDTLGYWLTEMQVDGFRFDLATTVNRETRGSEIYSFNPNSCFFKACFCHDIISQAIMIAEPWDCGMGGYHLGGYPVGWAEQNDRFRDDVRAFWRGDLGLIGQFATRLLGSRDVFVKNFRSINASINFVSYHDGFTLHDIVTYNQKHNEKNGPNGGGTDSNFSFNHGVEGETSDPTINAHRWQTKRNLIASVLLSQGTPHFLYGDECSRTQLGNNNAYCQDNEISWMSWDFSEEDKLFMKFISNLIKARKSSEMLRELILTDDFFHVGKYTYFAHWYKANGEEMAVTDWQNKAHNSIMLYIADTKLTDEIWCMLFNRSEHDIFFNLPDITDKHEWTIIIDSSEPDGIAKRFTVDKRLESVCAANSLKLLKAIKKHDPHEHDVFKHGIK